MRNSCRFTLACERRDRRSGPGLQASDTIARNLTPSRTLPARPLAHSRPGPGGDAAASLDEETQQTAEQNCLFGNRQTIVDLLPHLFRQQTLNRTSFRWAPLLHSLVGDPGTGEAISRVTARSTKLGRTTRIWMPWASLAQTSTDFELPPGTPSLSKPPVTSNDGKVSLDT